MTGKSSLIKEKYWCWTCLRWIRGHKPELTIEDVYREPTYDKFLWLSARGIRPTEGIHPNYRVLAQKYRWNYFPWNPEAPVPSLMNVIPDQDIQWAVIEDHVIPFCPYCQQSLIFQRKLTALKRWIKYPLLILGIGLSLWVLMVILGRDVLLWN